MLAQPRSRENLVVICGNTCVLPFHRDLRTYFITHVISPDRVQISKRSSTIDNAFTYEHGRSTRLGAEKSFDATSAQGSSVRASPLRMRPSRHQLAEGTMGGARAVTAMR